MPNIWHFLTHDDSSMGEKLTSACDLYRWQCGVIETTHPPVVVNDACQYYSWCCLRVLPRSSACEHNFSAPNQRSSHISHIKTSIQLAGRYVAYFFLVWGNPHIWSHIFDPSWKSFQLYSQKVDFFFNFSGICLKFRKNRDDLIDQHRRWCLITL